MKHGRLCIVFFLILVLGLAEPRLAAQEKIPDGISQKAWKSFQKARTAFETGEITVAREHADVALSEDPLYPDVYILSGDIYLEMNEPGNAVISYRKAFELNPEHPDIVLSLLANTLFSLERYPDACLAYQRLLDIPDITPDLRHQIKNKLSIAQFRKKLIENPVAFDPVNLGNVINSPEDEYINAVSTDENKLFFTRRVRTEQQIGIDPRLFRENFYKSVKKDDVWDTAAMVDFFSDQNGDFGALCFSPDGRTLYFTACFRPDSKGSCDIYYSEKHGENWFTPKNIGEHINSDLWDSQPSISPDGKTLYFSSNREGGFGNSDIWKTEKTNGDAWSKPVNLGKPINTTDAEMAPFIHYDNKTLYFSSKGHLGMGGADLFLSNSVNDSWSIPRNLGYPVNTSKDELVVIVNPEGNKGYISADLGTGFGKYDIYEFMMHDSIRPVAVTYMKGIVYDADTRNPISARFELIDIDNDSTILFSWSDPANGEFLVCIPSNRNYALNVSGEGYLFYSDHFQMKGFQAKSEPYIKDIPLQPIKIGRSIILSNIFFETDQYQLKDESKSELEKLVVFLNDNPKLMIEVSGHTDNVGTPQYNLELSEKRAGSVYNYLISRGIDKQRLSYKGYGLTKPVDTNETEEGRAKNRRTEAAVVGNR